MLDDKVRCEAYKNAIEASVKGKIVLDIGAGTGFLSVIAAKAGATHVYAVEYS
jgi:predicted RNA methylase